MSCKMYTSQEGPDGMLLGKEWKIDNVEVKIITLVIKPAMAESLAPLSMMNVRSW